MHFKVYSSVGLAYSLSCAAVTARLQDSFPSQRNPVLVQPILTARLAQAPAVAVGSPVSMDLRLLDGHVNGAACSGPSCLGAALPRRSPPRGRRSSARRSLPLVKWVTLALLSYQLPFRDLKPL